MKYILKPLFKFLLKDLLTQLSFRNKYFSKVQTFCINVVFLCIFKCLGLQVRAVNSEALQQHFPGPNPLVQHFKSSTL